MPRVFMALVLVPVAGPREMQFRYYGVAASTIRREAKKGLLAEVSWSVREIGDRSVGEWKEIHLLADLLPGDLEGVLPVRMPRDLALGAPRGKADLLTATGG